MIKRHTIPVIADPWRIAPAAMVIGAALLWTPWDTIGTWMATVGAAMFYFLRAFSFERWLRLTLENRFARPSHLPSKVDGILLLGGAVDPDMTEARGIISLGPAAERLLHFVDLAAKYPDAQLVHSGGHGRLHKRAGGEAVLTRQALDIIGLSGRTIQFEDASSNTRENAEFSKKLVRPNPNSVWILITTARHMPRAVGCFQKVGWSVIAYPVDYTMYGPKKFGFDPIPSLGDSGLKEIVEEWLALFVYRFSDWTPKILPKSDSPLANHNGSSKR